MSFPYSNIHISVRCSDIFSIENSDKKSFRRIGERRHSSTYPIEVNLFHHNNDGNCFFNFLPTLDFLEFNGQLSVFNLDFVGRVVYVELSRF